MQYSTRERYSIMELNITSQYYSINMETSTSLTRHSPIIYAPLIFQGVGKIKYDMLHVEGAVFPLNTYICSVPL